MVRLLSFREAMHPIVAAAEWELRTRLSLMERTGSLEFQKMIILDAHSVDVYGENKKGERHCFELDGPIHRTSEKVKVRDDYVRDLLERRKMCVWPMPYDPPISKRRLQEMVDLIGEKMLW